MSKVERVWWKTIKVLCLPTFQTVRIKNHVGEENQQRTNYEPSKNYVCMKSREDLEDEKDGFQ